MDTEVLIPITMFLVAGGSFITTMVLRLQKRKVESAEILAAIEKGVDIKFPEQPKKSRLLPVLMWLLTGLVMFFALGVMMPADAPSGIAIWGLVPVAVGASYLIVYRVEEQKGDSEEN